MGTRSMRAARCAGCGLHTHACLCDELPRFALETRVVLVMHHQERRKGTGTGRLALTCLRNSERMLHGLPDAPLDLHRLAEKGRRLLLLFPATDAQPLDTIAADDDSRPVTLVVPDGTWNQARRIPRRVPGLAQAQPVVLPEGPPSRWGIRSAPEAGSLSTFEAIARALGILESNAIQTQLEAAFERVVEATFHARGEPRRSPSY